MNKIACKDKRRIAIITAIVLLLVSVLSIQDINALSAPTASAQINAKSGAILRKKASTSSKKLKTLANNTKIVIKKEVFLSKTSTKAKKRWYQVNVAGKTGYVRADLIDNIKYSSITGKTTSALNYRVGPCEKMKKKGTLKKGASVAVVLNSNRKGDSTNWYKIKSGSKYYFVSSKYVKLVGNTTSAPTPTPAPVVSTPSSVSIAVSGITAPTSIGQGSACSIGGTVTCNQNIQKVVVGAVDTTGNWIIQASANVNATSYNLANIDSKVKFGLLLAGKYIYKVDVYVNGTVYNKVSKGFTISPVSGPTLLANTAKVLAWPKGTSSDKYLYSGGSATDAYKYALDKAYPDRSKWGAGPKVGASCDVFIGTICVYSGYDTSMHRGLNQQWTDFTDTSRWQKVNYSYKESELRNGDIIIYSKDNGSNHVCMYVTIDGEGCIAEAALDSKYGYINTSISKILKSSDKTKLYVYRAMK